MLTQVDRVYGAEFNGPRDLATGEWIVQLTHAAARDVRSLARADQLLDDPRNDFTIVSGLGDMGWILVRGRGDSQSQIEASLENNDSVESFSLNSLIQGQAAPDDPEYSGGLLSGLDRIDVGSAWDESIGSLSTVVGVIDSGIDAAHTDLYLNIWLNQGEIPDVVFDQLVDVDADGLITFYDLNNLRRTATGIVVASTGVAATVTEISAQTPFADGANAGLVEDKNGNGRIDADDLLKDVTWADGRDTDGNGFFDDLFGVNFRSGPNDSFRSNQPFDPLGHGTHVSGTIGAIGDNGFGVVGINWQTSLMSLRILDNNNQGDSAAAIHAINYARQMRSRLSTDANGRVRSGANVRVLNNSWGQPGGFEPALESAIGNSGDEGILFVAAAGNGNLLGNGVDNDRTPFYPASYELPNVIAVAALSASGERLATFSNFGGRSVDIAAPGAGVRSTLPGGAIGSANGTSMAAPHVTGVAALVWSALPEATVAEVREAILSTARSLGDGASILATGGRLDAAAAITAEVFAPSARMIAKPDITAPGGTETEFTVQYSHRGGIDVDSLGDDDVVVKRSWGPDNEIPVTLKPGSVTSDDKTATATYVMQAPGNETFAGQLSGVPLVQSTVEVKTFENNTPVAIPDAVSTITSEIFVENVSDKVTEVELNLNIEHTRVDDLILTLIAPDGDRAVLITRLGGNNRNFSGTTFSDSALRPIAGGSAPYTGVFRPQASISSLLDVNANGSWTLEVLDAMGANGGQLVDWSLSFVESMPVESQFANPQIFVGDLSETTPELKVTIGIASTDVGDLTTTLVSPDGHRSVLFSAIGGIGETLNIEFDDNASTLLVDGTDLTGVFRPQQSLASLVTSSPNGIWTLEIEDGGDGLSRDMELNWSLDFAGVWDPLDFGNYEVMTVEGAIASADGTDAIELRAVGAFNVRIDHPSVLYVDSFGDGPGEGSLRDAINAAAAAAPEPRTIILDQGTYSIDIPHQPDPDSAFPYPEARLHCGAAENRTGWSGELSGDFDITGNVTIIGNQNTRTVIDANQLDRVFKVHPGATLDLRRVEVTGGLAPSDQGGGGILSAGRLTIRDSVIRGNQTLGSSSEPSRGGGVAAWDGVTDVRRSWIDENESNYGGGIFYCGGAEGVISQSTLSNNIGGGLHSHSDSDLVVTTTTFSANHGGRGAIFNGKRDGFDRSLDDSRAPSISADGRFIAFQSDASNLVPGDRNTVPDIFVFDQVRHAVERVSIGSDGTESDSSNFEPSISADGRFVAFRTRATNLVPSDTNTFSDIFVFDRENDTIQRVSVGVDGAEADQASGDPAFSADGRFVAFVSFASNLVPDDTNGVVDVFAYDSQTETIERVSVDNDGAQANGESGQLSISADGRIIAFHSSATNLVPDDTNGVDDIFVYDRQSDTIERVSVDSVSAEADGESGSPSISADGRFVAFASDATNLAAEDTNGTRDIFVYDRQSGTIERVSVDNEGREANGSSENPSISTDGRFVAFESDATNLVAGDTNGARDVFIYDRQSGNIERVSVDGEGNEASGSSQSSSISADGRYVAFSSDASNLVPGDTNNSEDVFVYDRQTFELTPVSLVLPNPSVIQATQVTVVGTSNAEFSVTGHVHLHDSLLAQSGAGMDPERSLRTNVLEAFVSGTELIGPLTRIGTAPPIHPLLQGNPAIDAGAPQFVGTVDQLGTPRDSASDIGAQEANTASVRGMVFVDLDENHWKSSGEDGIPDVEVVAKKAGSDQIIRRVISHQAPSESDNGVIDLGYLPAGAYQFEVSVPEGWTVSSPAMQRVPPFLNHFAVSPSFSANGRFISFTSQASDLVSGDTNETADIFVYDWQTGSTERVSVHNDGIQGDGQSFTQVRNALSADGRFVVFQSYATNLVDSDTNASGDIFVFDRDSDILERVSVNDRGEQGNNFSWNAALSADGRYVTFQSYASNLVPGDTNGILDVFVFDRESHTIERVSVGDFGEQANGDSWNASLSANGRYVAFTSDASNLVPGDTNGASDVFVFDRQNNTIERVSIGSEGSQATGTSDKPSISDDGRFVAFESDASNLFQGDPGPWTNIFVRDRDRGSTEQVSVDSDGVGANDFSFSPSLSSDGRFVAFLSAASLVPDVGGLTHVHVYVYDRHSETVAWVSTHSDRFGDPVQFFEYPSLSPDGRFVGFATDLPPVQTPSANFFDVYAAANPLADFSTVRRTIAPGAVITDLNFGLVPDPGSLSGTLYEDTVHNGAFDAGEPTLAGWTVFLDSNSNRRLDDGEVSAKSAADGTYEFADMPAFRNYTIAVVPPIGWKPLTPETNNNFAWEVFLPPAGMISGRDFAFAPVTGSGQSSNSSVAGRIFADKNDNGVYDEGIDEPLSKTVVYLDSTQNVGIRDENEPAVETDAEGNYLIKNLGASVVAVSTQLEKTTIHASPLGSQFESATFPLFSKITPFGNPQAIASGDFNQDGFPDVAVALGEANKLSIRLNDGSGGFLPEEIDVDLGTLGSGPTALVVGQWDDDPRLDVALTANFTGYATVLLNFDPIGKAFASIAYVKVGDEPLDIAAGDFTGDGKAELVVVNKATNTVQILTNNGFGEFTAGPGILTGGNNSVSIVAGDFTGDSSLDVAVVHASPLTTGTPTPFGGVTVLRGDGAGGLTLEENYYEVGALPIDSVTADFDGDGRADLAISNFSSNSISILLGQADGTFRVQSAILGTASGAFDIAVGDIDNDGDQDIIASNLKDRNISIFRNIGVDPTSGDVRFEPLENVGLGQFSMAQRMPLVLANFDQDRSGPGGTGTIDIVTIPQQTDTLHLLTNRLVNGSHRVALTGRNVITGLDFIIEPAILNPTLDPIADPIPILEDASFQTVVLTGITKGRDAGPDLQFSVVSSNPSLVSNPTINHTAGELAASLVYTPVADASGTSVITVTVTDAGANQLFGDDDDGSVTKSFTVTVQPVNDPPTFNLRPIMTVTEDIGPQSIDDFAIAIGPGGGSNEATQDLLGFVVTTDNDFFATPPAIDSQGRLTFTTADNVSGNVSVNVSLSDSGGTLNGGNDTKSATFVISILPVNDGPSFTLGSNITVVADSGSQTRMGFASGFVPGGGSDEASQTVSDYLVTNDAPELFKVLPDISNTGTLTFAPAAGRSGVANISVQVRDNGGQLNGGVDLSTVQTFTITVEPGGNGSVTEIVLTGSGETVEMAALPDSLLATVHTVDIRGSGNNRVLLDANKIASLTPNQSLLVIANGDDEVVFDGDWQFSRIEVVDNRLQRIFTQGAATVRVVGPADWTNPYNATDVNANGTGTAADALVVINAIGSRLLADEQGNLLDATTVDPSRFNFYDANQDGRLSASDALFVINRIGADLALGEGEFSIALPLLLSPDSLQAGTIIQPSHVDLSTDRKLSSFASPTPEYRSETMILPHVNAVSEELETPSSVDEVLTDTLDWL